MSGFQSPQLLTDLYRDLRDRRLLPLVVVLVVGLAIVPMALSSSPPSPAPQAAVPAAPVAKRSTVPAVPVVRSDPGLRDYRRRLQGDLPKDPFVQQFTAASGLAGAQLSPIGGSSSATGSTTTPTTSSETTSSGTTSTSGPVSSGDVTGSQPAIPTASPTETKLVFYRVKIRTGQVGGELKVQDEVPPLRSLPGGPVPALGFLGATMDSGLNPKRAFFLVSNSASLTGGDGTCVVGSPCQLLALKPGQYVDLAWTDGLTYRVKLVKFRRHVRDKPLAQLGDQSASPSG
jgi:hypothetical protein